MDSLRDKVAVVTGGGSGIGQALCYRLAAEGMAVVVADVDEVAARAVAEELGARGAQVAAVATDVRDGDQVEALATLAVARFGGVHLVCNNAGVEREGLAWESTVEEWAWVLDVNLWGVIHGIRAFVPRIIASGGGHVVNTASMAGLVYGSFSPAYTVSKTAVVSLSEVLSLQLRATKAPVGVSVLCPGWVRTGIGDSGRHLPAGTPVAPANPTLRRVHRGLTRVLRDAMAPESVAEAVITGVLTDRFYLLPHDDDAWLRPITDRAATILAGEHPVAPRVPGADVIAESLAQPDDD